MAGWTEPCSSVMSLVMELPPAELHCLFSLKSLRLTAQWSEMLPSTGLRWWLLSKETAQWLHVSQLDHSCKFYHGTSVTYRWVCSDASSRPPWGPSAQACL